MSQTSILEPSPPMPGGTSLDARAVALEALIRIDGSRLSLVDSLAVADGFEALEPRDRAFARRLVTTVLRRQTEIDALIDSRLKRPLPAGPARRLRPLLALGVAQCLYLEAPPHAAVNTTVALAGSIQGGRFKPLVNAILRALARDGAALAAQIDSSRLNTPDWLWEQWSAAYGPERCRRIAEIHLLEPPLDLTPRDPGEAETLALRLKACLLFNGTLRLAQPGSLDRLPGFSEGAWWVQDCAASLPARLLGDVRGKRILDLCAAPGGKTMQLASAGATVTALDSSEARLGRLRENLARTGLEATLITADGRSWTPPAPFEGVLLDAPCTATGTLRRHPDIARRRSPSDAQALAPLQDALLAAAARATAPGGRLVYAVCSLDPAEGEGRIEPFLKIRPDFRREPIGADEIGGLGHLLTPEGSLRTLPCHLGTQGGMDGFHAVRLRRSGEADR